MLKNLLELLLIMLGLGVVFLSLVYAEEEKNTMQFINDEWLRLRMTAVNIPTWKELRKKSGLEPLALKRIRQAEVKKINFSQLTKLATVLNWQPEELLPKLGLLPVTENDNLLVLHKECERLQSQLEQQKSELTQEIRESIFNQLQTLLTNYPSLRQMIEVKPELPVKNIIALFTPLDNVLESWNYEPIGQAWEQVEYSPELHQADSSDIAVGEKVYIRFVGYRDGERIICPAKVSRTLPGGAI